LDAPSKHQPTPMFRALCGLYWRKIDPVNRPPSRTGVRVRAHKCKPRRTMRTQVRGPDDPAPHPVGVAERGRR